MDCYGPRCTRPAVALGLCASHHRQHLRGRPLAPLKGRPEEPTEPITLHLRPTTIAALGPEPRARAREILERATQKGSKRT